MALCKFRKSNGGCTHAEESVKGDHVIVCSSDYIRNAIYSFIQYLFVTPIILYTKTLPHCMCQKP